MKMNYKDIYPSGRRRVNKGMAKNDAIDNSKLLAGEVFSDPKNQQSETHSFTGDCVTC